MKRQSFMTLVITLGLLATPIPSNAQFFKNLGKALEKAGKGIIENTQIQYQSQQQTAPSVNFSNLRLTYDQVDANNGRKMLQVHYNLTATGLQGHTLIPVLAIEIPQGTWHKFANGSDMKSEGNQLICNYQTTIFNGQWQAIYIDALNPLPGKHTYYARIYLVDMTLGRQIAASNYLTFTNTGEQQQTQQQSKVQQQAGQQAQQQNKVFREAVYPSGYWFIPANDSNPLQVELRALREKGVGEPLGDCSRWGEITLFTENIDMNGELDNPTKIGEVYYFDIISKNGSGRIGLYKTKDNDGVPSVNVAECSGPMAKWIRKGMELHPYPVNGREYDPTLTATTEEELTAIMKDMNEDYLNGYVYWMKLLYPNDPTTVMSHLSFEPQSKKFVRPKGNDVRLRYQGNAKSEVLGHASECDILPVDEENAGWYGTRLGWISKTVAKPVTFNSVTSAMMNTNQCGRGYDLDTYNVWRVQSPVGKTGLALCVQNKNGMEYLRLGKLVGNVFVFKYCVEFRFEFDEQTPKTFKITMEKGYEGTRAVVKAGTDFCVRLNQPDYQPWVLDLSRFSAQGLLKMFENEIAEGFTDYWYMGSELLTGEYSNFSLD